MNTLQAHVSRVLLLLAVTALTAAAQGDIVTQADGYEWPQEQEVRERLARWQDLKFGVLLHWGIYSVPGIVESWSICDENWIRRDTTMTYEQYLDWYESLADRFCPRDFNPQQWASTCREAGMRYSIFTTKHHDGFCLWDSRETDFTIARHAFAGDPRRDVLRHVFDAYRNEGFMVGAYFSKPDWHSPYYWWDVYAKKGRNVNYPVDQFPWRWEQFRRFTHRQVRELMSDYGPVDILWLDGGWVYPENRGQDIDIPAMASMARDLQPGLIIVDRTIRGPYENYQTPEQQIPQRQLLHPWESCISLSDDWGYVRHPRWKSARRVVNTLAEVVAKGGNLVLGVGPTPEGIIEAEAVRRLRDIGRWLAANGRAIYATKPLPHYHEPGIWFTQSKDGRSRFAICTLDEQATAPATIGWHQHLPAKGQRVRMLATGQRLRHAIVGDSVTVMLPAGLHDTFVLEIR